MTNSNIPHIILNEKFDIVKVDDYIKNVYPGFTTRGFFKTLLSGYEVSDFNMPVIFDPPVFSTPNVRLMFVRDEDRLVCVPVKSEADVLAGGYRSVHYQMREPISGIFATLPMLNNCINNDRPERAAEALDGIYKQSFRLLRNVTNISITSRLMSGAVPERVGVDFSSLLNKIIDGVRTVERDVTIEAAIEDNVFIGANYSLISTAVLNLIANSIKYGTDEPVVIRISLQKSGKSSIFEYSDNSKGIKDGVLPFIFKPYFSKDPYNDGEPDPSLGLGLFIFKTAFEQAGGNILASSSFGYGVSYTVTLPPDDSPLMLASEPTPFLLDRFSELFIQLCENCDLPSLN